MRANLSLVLDEKGEIRYDLFENFPLEEIDRYTVTKKNSQEIREDFQEELRSYQNLQKSYRALSKRKNKGRIVITYLDENQRIHTLKVLYQDQKEKLNVEQTLKEIIKTLKEEENPNLTIQLIMENKFLYSEFARKKIKRAQEQGKYGVRKSRNANISLTNTIVKNSLQSILHQNPERAYFYIRKLDRYLEIRKENKKKEDSIPKTETSISEDLPEIQSKIKDLKVEQISLENYFVKRKSLPQNEIAQAIIREYQESKEPFRMADFALEYEERLHQGREGRVLKK